MSERYLDGVKDLPVVPEVVAKVLSLTEEKLDISFRELEAIIKVDPGLTAKILKIANSALYARQREVKSLQTAITLLGFKNIKSLVLLITASKLFPRMAKNAFHGTYWRHSNLCAFLSRNLAVRCGNSAVSEEVFIAALIQDIGQAVLFNAAPEQYKPVLEAEKAGAFPIEAFEERIFQTNHREVGGALLKQWNFPELYVDTAREHGTMNVTSVHKPLIFLVSAASLIADGMDTPAVNPTKEELFARLLPYTCLGSGDIAYFATSLAAEISQDKLYLEYQSLIEAA